MTSPADSVIATDPDLSTAEHVLQVATAMFARQGYHGASIREIARQVGISVATLYYYIQSKDDLYRQVFQRQYQEEYALIQGLLESVDERVTQDPRALREVLFSLMDSLIDRSVQNPDIVRLWTRRWLERPAQTGDIESEFSMPLYGMVEDWLERARGAGAIQPDEINLRLMVRSFTWLHYGFCGYGQLSYVAMTDGGFHPEQIEEFRSFVRTFVARMLRFTDQT